jgi:ATP-dependent Clp protease protease subunit
MALALRCPAAASPSPAKSTFPPSSSPPPSRLPRRPPASCRCYYYGDGGGFRKNYDHIPKQFREENLKDGRELTFPPLHFPNRELYPQ